MSYKTLLAPIMFEDTAGPVLQSALAIAKVFHSHIHAKHVRQKQSYYPPATYYPLSPDAAAATYEATEKAADAFAGKLRAIFDSICTREKVSIVSLQETSQQKGITASWQDEYGTIHKDLGYFARASDLSILTLPETKAAGLEASVFESLLMGSGRPVLLVPRSGLEAIPKRVLVAWDGSLPGARALGAALPFLEQTEETVVVTVGSADSGTPDCHDATRFLQRHGIRTSAKKVDWPKRPIAERLLNQAEAHNCEMIVMGAYSHARLFESLLGGVTHHMLEHADRAVLMAHQGSQP